MRWSVLCVDGVVVIVGQDSIHAIYHHNTTHAQHNTSFRTAVILPHNQHTVPCETTYYMDKQSKHGSKGHIMCTCVASHQQLTGRSSQSGTALRPAAPQRGSRMQPRPPQPHQRAAAQQQQCCRQLQTQRLQGAGAYVQAELGTCGQALCHAMSVEGEGT